MFTGIVQGIAKVARVEEKHQFRSHVLVFSPALLQGLQTGASVAHNGCCLTVTAIDGQQVRFDLMQETLRVTSLGALQPGDWVNIERAACLGDEIGGHFMSGHIMTVADVVKINDHEDNRKIWFKARDSMVMKYIFNKGFIGVDGISLTVCDVTTQRFAVNLIPETLQRTTIGRKGLGQQVNIEVDPQTQAIVDTVERVLAQQQAARG